MTFQVDDPSSLFQVSGEAPGVGFGGCFRGFCELFLALGWSIYAQSEEALLRSVSHSGNQWSPSIKTGKPYSTSFKNQRWAHWTYPCERPLKNELNPFTKPPVNGSNSTKKLCPVWICHGLLLFRLIWRLPDMILVCLWPPPWGDRSEKRCIFGAPYGYVMAS